MGKTSRIEEFMVVCHIDDRYSFGDKEKAGRQRADAVREFIECALRGGLVGDIGSVSIETDTSTVCEFCGDDWTEGDSPHNGGCCGKDIEVMDRTEPDITGKTT